MKKIILLVSIYLLIIGNNLCYSNTFNQGIAKIYDDIEKKLNNTKKIKLAIIDFPDIEGNLNNLGKVVNDKLIYNFSLNNKLIVLERTELRKILTELKLSHSGLINADSAKKIGELLGTDILIIGRMTLLDDDLDINCRCVNIESGQIIAASNVTIPLSPSVKKLYLQKYDNLNKFKSKEKKIIETDLPAQKLNTGNISKGYFTKWESKEISYGITKFSIGSLFGDNKYQIIMLVNGGIVIGEIKEEKLKILQTLKIGNKGYRGSNAGVALSSSNPTYKYILCGDLNNNGRDEIYLHKAILEWDGRSFKKITYIDKKHELAAPYSLMDFEGNGKYNYLIGRQNYSRGFPYINGQFGWYFLTRWNGRSYEEKTIDLPIEQGKLRGYYSKLNKGFNTVPYTLKNHQLVTECRFGDVNGDGEDEFCYIDPSSSKDAHLLIFSKNHSKIWESYDSVGNSFDIIDLNQNKVKEIIARVNTFKFDKFKSKNLNDGGYLRILEWDRRSYSEIWKSKKFYDAITCVRKGKILNDGLEYIIFSTVSFSGKSKINILSYNKPK